MEPQDHHTPTCPYCETGGLHPGAAPTLFRCDGCGSELGGGLLNALLHIRALPDALGRHACECGHPEMRLLPDGVFCCPACRAEVLPHDVRR